MRIQIQVDIAGSTLDECIALALADSAVLTDNAEWSVVEQDSGGVLERDLYDLLARLKSDSEINGMINLINALAEETQKRIALELELVKERASRKAQDNLKVRLTEVVEMLYDSLQKKHGESSLPLPPISALRRLYPQEGEPAVFEPSIYLQSGDMETDIGIISSYLKEVDKVLAGNKHVNT